MKKSFTIEGIYFHLKTTVCVSFASTLNWREEVFIVSVVIVASNKACVVFTRSVDSFSLLDENHMALSTMYDSYRLNVLIWYRNYGNSRSDVFGNSICYNEWIELCWWWITRNTVTVKNLDLSSTSGITESCILKVKSSYCYITTRK